MIYNGFRAKELNVTCDANLNLLSDEARVTDSPFQIPDLLFFFFWWGEVSGLNLYPESQHPPTLYYLGPASDARLLQKSFLEEKEYR